MMPARTLRPPPGSLAGGSTRSVDRAIDATGYVRSEMVHRARTLALTLALPLALTLALPLALIPSPSPNPNPNPSPNPHPNPNPSPNPNPKPTPTPKPNAHQVDRASAYTNDDANTLSHDRAGDIGRYKEL
jgi:hypothetical protein